MSKSYKPYDLNHQCAVDTDSQIIIAADVTIENDVRQVEPMVSQITENMDLPPSGTLRR